MSVISHRDQTQGVVCHENVAIGHRRLAIIDLPMMYTARPIGQVIGVGFNGDSCFVELGRNSRLEVFRSQSDTEVLLQTGEWGKNVSPSSMALVIAIFIIAATVSSVRGQFGEKPFYFTQQRDGFYFGSEIVIERVGYNGQQELVEQVSSWCC